MDIPNLATEPKIPDQNKLFLSLPIILIVIVLAIVSGFWLSRFFPLSKNTVADSVTGSVNSTDSISGAQQLEVGKIYGNQEKNFKDSATGTIEKGSINGEGTHILNREGGLSQRASLTSSAVDLDLFVGKKVEIHGETNSSTKTAWLLDVGNIKILE